MWTASLTFIIIHVGLAIAIEYDTTFDYACDATVNCTKTIPNSICLNGKCVCPFGYESGRCVTETNSLRFRRQETSAIRMLGEECSWTNQCRRTMNDFTKVCLARICQCASGYIAVDAYGCMRLTESSLLNVRLTKSLESEPLGYGSPCFVDTDCQQVYMHLTCVRGICVCLEGYVPIGKYLCFNTYGQAHSTTLATVFPVTSTNQPMNNEVMKSLGKIGNSCINDYFCRRTVPQSHCYNGRCTCIQGYIPIDQYTCMEDMSQYTTPSTPIPVDYKSLLGGKCSTRHNCHTPNAICLYSICTCPEGYFPVDDWTCLEDSESSDEASTEPTSTTTTTITTPSTTTVFRWWPWSPTPTTRPPYLNMANVLRFRCLLNRQCASIDKNSHCTFFGRCVCNGGYDLKTTGQGQQCVQRATNHEDNDEDCD